MAKMNRGKQVVGTALCSAALWLAAGAHAAPPSLVGPSNAQANAPAVFSGNQFAPNTAVTIAVRAPSGAEAHYGAVVNAQGKLEYRFSPQEAGLYSVRVLDSGGRQLSATTLKAIR